MCKEILKEYILPSGEERRVVTRRYCSRSDGKTLCHDYERVDGGRVFMQPDLVDDERLQPSPSSSANFPPTPDSVNVEVRQPARRPSTREGRGKRIDVSNLRIRTSSSRHA